ncbi:MAG: TIGR00282 family metallophosphoesterase [Phycisphaera sp.]|nr:TIGR00282 family metallophosphoesterase [Phycisphaera sp.]
MAFRFIMLGDIVGRPGRRVVQQHIAALRQQHRADLVIANGENIAGGSGITTRLYQKLLSYGVDGVTLGDHAFRQAEIVPVMHQHDRLIRPFNLPEQAPGQGAMVLETNSGLRVHVITLLGRLFISNPLADDPFAAADLYLQEVGRDEAVIVEIHAEATSEKLALAHYLDGRVAAVLGTHTHTPTADARVLPGGTAFISDLGMCGPYDSVLGRLKDRVVQFMSTANPARFEVADDTNDTRLCGVLVELDDHLRATRCERVEVAADLDNPPFNAD